MTEGKEGLLTIMMLDQLNIYMGNKPTKETKTWALP